MIASCDINPLFDEVLEDIESKDSYDSNLDEPDLLVTPLSDANKDECFNSGGKDDEINVLDCEDSYYDSEGDILYLESLLNDDLVHRDFSISVASILEGFTNEPPLKENDDLFDLEYKNDDWKKILYDAPILMTEDKVFDLGIHDQIFSPTYDSYDSNLDEPDLLVTPLFDANKDESFNSGGKDDEINVLDYEDSYYDSEGDILYLESLLNDDLVHRDLSISVVSILEGFTDEPPLKENDDLFDLESKNDDWKKILYDAPILMTEDKVFDLGI
nr:hypothetical protein [Tanacetum cinerariifolium]